MENGPEFITSFLSCINSTVAAPLNPNYTASEFNFYFKDLKPKALITNLPSNHPSIKISYKNMNERMPEWLQETEKLVIWDDHDYGLNDAGENYLYKAESQKIYNNF